MYSPAFAPLSPLVCSSLFSPQQVLSIHHCYNATSLGHKEQGWDDNDDIDDNDEEDDKDDANDSHAGSSVNSQATNEEREQR
jgi:hypothetical protein